MTTARNRDTAILLPDDRVLVLGGFGLGDETPLLASAELYDQTPAPGRPPRA
jgi:hypothetical protein